MKYSNAELQQMAITLLAAKRNRDERYFQFVMGVSLATGYDPATIQRTIRRYAKGVFN